MRLVIMHEAIDQRFARHQLYFGIEGRANGKAALVQLLIAVAHENLAAHLLGEKAGGDRIGRQYARSDGQWFGARLLRLLLRDIAVLSHAADDVIAPIDGAIVVAERIEFARLLGQRRQIGDLGDRQLMHRFVEIVQRRSGDAIIAEAEVNFIEVELENLFL